jgi:hypothetical protein
MVDKIDCRTLQENDRNVIPSYFDIVQTGLEGLRSRYPSSQEIEEARAKYTENFLVKQLTPNESCRLIGAFGGDSLDGVLIEGFRKQEAYSLTRINWMFARTPGAGVGTVLLRDAKTRAESEGKDILELLVSEDNPRARALYSREGFIETADFPKFDGLIPMFYFVNPELKKYYGIK